MVSSPHWCIDFARGPPAVQNCILTVGEGLGCGMGGVCLRPAPTLHSQVAQSTTAPLRKLVVHMQLRAAHRTGRCGILPPWPPGRWAATAERQRAKIRSFMVPISGMGCKERQD